MIHRWRFAAFAWLLALALPAAAETYRVDLIVFLDKSVSGEAGQAPSMPALDNALEPGDVAALTRAGIVLLPDEQFGLQEHWQRLRNSRRYQPLVKLAWTQPDPPAERGPALRVRVGQTQVLDASDAFSSVAMSPVEGSIALLLNRYLMVDANLVYTMPSGSGYVAYPLRERRRMRRDELHYLDSPKLGVVARVSKAGAPSP